MIKNLTVRNRLFSFSFPVATLLCTLSIVAVSLMIFMLSLSLGNETFSLTTVLSTLLNNHPEDPHFAIQTVRLPRTLMAALVGSALASSGLILQSTIRNPLASPDVIGITGGASAAAVCFLSFFNTSLGIAWLPVFAIAGAFCTAIFIYGLAWQNGVTPMRLILIGMGVSAAMGALTTFVIAASPLSTSISAYIWLTGSVYGSDWQDVAALLPWVAICLPVTFYLTRRINAQELGDSIATGLGISMQKLRVLLLLISVVLAAPAIAYAGAISFVGLIAPHIARQLVIRSFGVLLPVTALLGACLVMLADLGGRLLFQPLDIPAGVFVSAIGAPFFLYLLIRQRF